MICPGCKLDTPPDKKYCEFCGLALDLDFETVEESLDEEILAERQVETIATTRGWFLYACFFLVLTLLFRTLVDRPGTPEGIGFEYRVKSKVRLPEPLEVEPIGRPIPTGR